MKDSERIKRMKKYLKSPCPACGDPIYVCNDNPDTNHYELVVNALLKKESLYSTQRKKFFVPKTPTFFAKVCWFLCKNL